jgi:hypothetical protein
MRISPRIKTKSRSTRTFNPGVRGTAFKAATPSQTRSKNTTTTDSSGKVSKTTIDYITPAAPEVAAVAPIAATSTSTYSPSQSYQASFKVPSPVVFVTGMSLVIINNSNNGVLTELWNLILHGQEIKDIKTDTRQFIGEVIFVVVVSFLAEISGAVAGFSFVFFIALWVVWSVHNSDVLAKWYSNATVNPNPPKK